MASITTTAAVDAAGGAHVTLDEMKWVADYPSEDAIQELRKQQFPMLNTEVYLDHAGTTLPSAYQLQASTALLSGSIWGNPHSRGPASQRTTDAIESLRATILDWFGTTRDSYTVVFTSGATGGAKIIADSFPWCPGSQFWTLQDNHTSVIGMRGVAEKARAQWRCVTVAEALANNAAAAASSSPSTNSDEPWSLFAFPGESNFNGTLYPLELIRAAHNGCGTFAGRKWRVLLDAAKLASTSRLDLSSSAPDFVILSLYKLFGYPTGAGVLLIRNDAVADLQRTYFGGGTVAAVSSTTSFVRLREATHARFEDGTLPFQGLITAAVGFQALSLIGIDRISEHTRRLTRYCYDLLTSLRHAAGTPVAVVYVEPKDMLAGRHGSILAFNLIDADGIFVSAAAVEKVAALHHIQLRTGCVCNPGACQMWLSLSGEDVERNLQAGHVCWDDNDMIDGRPTGAVRLSFGYMSSESDVDAFIRVVQEHFVQTASVQVRMRSLSAECPHAQPTLVGLAVYPVKSCAPFIVQSWPVSASGLLHDREWSVVDAAGNVLTQKHGFEDLVIPLEHEPGTHGRDEQLRTVVLCGRECVSVRTEHDSGSSVTSWMSHVFGRPYTLMRSNAEPFANEAPFLLCNNSSIRDLNRRLGARYTDAAHTSHPDVTAAFFRPNFVVDGVPCLDEDTWLQCKIGDVPFQVTGSCSRCRMINIDQSSGVERETSEPLLTLSKYRRIKSNILFGRFLKLSDAVAGAALTLSVGDRITILSRSDEVPLGL